jgi:hypothetical protein
MFLSVITAPIVLAELIDFLTRRCYVNPPMFEDNPANFIRLAYSRYEYVCANTIGVVMVSSYWPKFAALRLFIETMPIYNAVASGNGKIEFYRETTSSNLKYIQYIYT